MAKDFEFTHYTGCEATWVEQIAELNRMLDQQTLNAAQARAEAHQAKSEAADLGNERRELRKVVKALEEELKQVKDKLCEHNFNTLRGEKWECDNCGRETPQEEL